MADYPGFNESQHEVPPQNSGESDEEDAGEDASQPHGSVDHPFLDLDQYAGMSIAPGDTAPISTYSSMTEERETMPPVIESDQDEAQPEPKMEPQPKVEPQPEPEPEPIEAHGDTQQVTSTSTPSCQSRCAIVSFLAKIYFNENVQHILLWRNIGLTAGVLVVFLYTAFSIALLSFLSVVGYYGLAIIVCTVAIRLYRNILAAIGKQQGANFYILELVDRAAEAEWSVSKDCAQAAIGKACDAFNAVACDIRDVIVVRSYGQTFKAGLALYLLTWIGGIFNLLTLVILVVLNLFYIPLLLVKFDLLNNKEINAFVLQIHGYVQRGFDVVRQKAPFLANFFESKVKTA